MKKHFKVSFDYWPHESLCTDEWFVYGTREQARKFLEKEMKNHPCSHNIRTGSDFVQEIKFRNL